MKSVFDKNPKMYDAWYEKHRYAFLSEIEAIKKVLPNNKKGLEIGVGTGRFAKALKITMGIDPSRNMLKIAKARGVNVKLGCGERIPFQDGVFDYVAIIISLCFVKAPLKVLSEAYRVLKNNGKVIIAIVDKKSFLGRFYKKKRSIFYEESKFYSVPELVRLLEKAKFASFNFFQTISVLPKEMVAVEKTKKGFGKCGFVVISAKKANKLIR